MEDRLAAQGIHLRGFRWEDIPAQVNLRNRCFPDTPQTVEWVEHFEQTYPPDNPRRRFAVDDGAGIFIGVGVCDVPYWLDAPGVYRFYAMIDPLWRRRGIGQTLLAKLEPFAREQGAARLISDCRENLADSIRFLERSGFQQFGLRFESVCDLTTFDESRFAGAIDRVAADGYEFTTLAAERRIDPHADRALYDLDELISQDIPWPGGLKASMTYENFHRTVLASPETDPTMIFIAKFNHEYAGYTSVSFRTPRLGYTGMTGVRREHRGRGLALALKLLAIHALLERGCTATLTQNDTANQPILALNRKLGYRQSAGILLWEKRL